VIDPIVSTRTRTSTLRGGGGVGVQVELSTEVGRLGAELDRLKAVCRTPRLTAQLNRTPRPTDPKRPAAAVFGQDCAEKDGLLAQYQRALAARDTIVEGRGGAAARRAEEQLEAAEAGARWWPAPRAAHVWCWRQVN
jgi:hypothetical protein